MQYLKQIGIADRVSLLLNRKLTHEAALGDEAVAQAVGMPITYSFPNDYTGVQHSIVEGGPVAHSSDLGHNILALAKDLVPHLEPKPTQHARRFLEFFHISSFHDKDATWQG